MRRSRTPDAALLFDVPEVQHRAAYAVALTVLLLGLVTYLGRDALLDYGASTHPVLAQEVAGHHAVRWNDARWKLRWVRSIDASNVHRERWEDPIATPKGTQYVSVRIDYTPTRDVIDPAAPMGCTIQLSVRDGRRWDAGVHVDEGDLVPDTASCSSNADGDHLHAGRTYALRSTYLVPASIDLERLRVEVRTNRRSLHFLRFTQ